MHIGGFILLTKRKSRTWKCSKAHQSRQKLKRKSIELNQEEIFCDFEFTAINAAKTVFPSVSVNGCHFHFCQAIKKRIKSLKVNN